MLSTIHCRTVTVGGDGVYYESFELNNFVMEDYVELPPEDEWLDRYMIGVLKTSLLASLQSGSP